MLRELKTAHAGQMYFCWLCPPQERAVIQEYEMWSVSPAGAGLQGGTTALLQTNRLPADILPHPLTTASLTRPGRTILLSWRAVKSTGTKQKAHLHFGWTCLSRAAAVCTGTDAAESSPPFPLLVSQAPGHEEKQVLIFTGTWTKGPEKGWYTKGCQ